MKRRWASRVEICPEPEWHGWKNDLVGTLFAIMGEKNTEDGVLPHLRKYKARVVFAGNNIQTASGTQAHELFQEVSQTLAAMGSVRAPLGIAALQGHIPKVRDATQAYIQARIDGPDKPRTWVRLPRQWWPAAWFDASGKPVYEDPVVRLVRAYMDTRSRVLCGMRTSVRS